MWARWKIFESHAIYHAFHGLQAVRTCNPDWYSVVIPNYFDLNDFDYCEDKDDYFLFVGRVYSGKGIIEAIQITEKIGAKLVICGQGNLKDAGYDEPPSHVTMLGHIGKEKRRKLMARAKGAFCISHYHEPFCGVQIEMMLSGTPVISPDWGAFVENNIHGVTGYRCRTFDQFCKAAKNIGNINPKDCRRWALNFSLEKVGKLYEDYFEDVMDVCVGAGWYAEHPDRTWVNKGLMLSDAIDLEEEEKLEEEKE
jgi:glycosyltransferase involved in cell wall biosynthesis